jgi:hypothetical protein
MWFNSNTTGESGIGYIPTAQVNPWLLPVLGFTASGMMDTELSKPLLISVISCIGIMSNSFIEFLQISLNT